MSYQDELHFEVVTVPEQDAMLLPGERVSLASAVEFFDLDPRKYFSRSFKAELLEISGYTLKIMHGPLP
ncbi:MAG: hypothetical protein U0984_14355 [Prosthecobacter sp.]|nr:hypothetical protein [Prosthecobacter sp.]